MTYATEPPHTVLEPSTKHEEETNKGTKGNILKLTNVIEGFSSLAEIVFKEVTQANTNADTEPTREATNRRRGHRNDASRTTNRKQRPEKIDYDMQTKESAQFISSAGFPLFPIVRGAGVPPPHCLH